MKKDNKTFAEDYKLLLSTYSEYAKGTERFKLYMSNMSNEERLKLIEQLLHQSFTDPNYSYAAESVGALTAGFEPHPWWDKHGLDSPEQNGEGKPVKMFLNGSSTYNGSFTFVDCSMEKILSMVEKNTKVYIPVIVEGVEILNLVVPMGTQEIKQRLVSNYESIMEKTQKDSKARRTNVSVILDNYKSDKNVELKKCVDNICDYKHKLGSKFYKYIQELKNK